MIAGSSLEHFLCCHFHSTLPHFLVPVRITMVYDHRETVSNIWSVIAGFLSNPLKVKYSLKEGSTNLLDRYPYASPLLINAGAIFLLTVVVSLYLEEVWCPIIRCPCPCKFSVNDLNFLDSQKSERRCLPVIQIQDLDIPWSTKKFTL